MAKSKKPKKYIKKVIKVTPEYGMDLKTLIESLPIKQLDKCKIYFDFDNYNEDQDIFTYMNIKHDVYIECETDEEILNPEYEETKIKRNK